MPENIESRQQSATHLAAKAVIAYRAGLPVALLSVTDSDRPSGIVFDWKGRPKARLKATLSRSG